MALAAAARSSRRAAAANVGHDRSTTADGDRGEGDQGRLVTDLGQLNDHGFNERAYSGLKRAERVLGVKGAVVESAVGRRLHPEHVDAARSRATT